MPNLRMLRNSLTTAVLTGTMLLVMTLPAHAYWIFHWAGPYTTQSDCLSDRQAFIDQETSAGQMFNVTPCSFQERNPETGFGPAGWFFRWGIFAA